LHRECKAKRALNFTAKIEHLIHSYGVSKRVRTWQPSLSFNITTVVKSAPGRLPASSLASDSVSQSECYERSNSVIPLMHRKHFNCRESVHLVWFSHFNRCILSTTQTVVAERVYIEHEQCPKPPASILVRY